MSERLRSYERREQRRQERRADLAAEIQHASDRSLEGSGIALLHKKHEQKQHAAEAAAQEQALYQSGKIVEFEASPFIRPVTGQDQERGVKVWFKKRKPAAPPSIEMIIFTRRPQSPIPPDDLPPLAS